MLRKSPENTNEPSPQVEQNKIPLNCDKNVDTVSLQIKLSRCLGGLTRLTHFDLARKMAQLAMQHNDVATMSISELTKEYFNHSGHRFAKDDIFDAQAKRLDLACELIQFSPLSNLRKHQNSALFKLSRRIPTSSSYSPIYEQMNVAIIEEVNKLEADIQKIKRKLLAYIKNENELSNKHIDRMLEDVAIIEAEIKKIEPAKNIATFARGADNNTFFSTPNPNNSLSRHQPESYTNYSGISDSDDEMPIPLAFNSASLSNYQSCREMSESDDEMPIPPVSSSANTPKFN